MPHIHLGELLQVPAFLKDLGIQPRIEMKMETEGIADIITATRQDDGERMIRSHFSEEAKWISLSRATGQASMPASTFGDCRESELRPWHELSCKAKTFAPQDNEDAHGRIRKSAVGINSDFEQFVGRGHYYGKVDEADFVFQTVMPFTQKSYGMWGKCGIEIR